MTVDPTIPLMWAETIAAEAERLRDLGVHPVEAWERAAGVWTGGTFEPARDRVMEVLREVPCASVAEIAVALGATRARIAELLRPLAARGAVVRVGSRPRVRGGGHPHVLWAVAP